MLPISYWEWGICVLTVYFCWWKYGWNMDVMKGGRQMYKKFENILLSPSPHPIKISSVDTWDAKHSKIIPATRVKFNPRTKRKAEESSKYMTELFFYTSLKPKIEEKDPNNNAFSCLVCTHPGKKVVFDEVKQGVPLKNCLDCDGLNEPHHPWYIRKFSHFAFFWKKWFIGEQFHMVSLKDMMSDERLNRASEDAAKQEFKDNPKSGPLEALITKHKRRTEAMVVRMRAKQPKHPWFALYVRISSWIIGKCLMRIYPKILVRDSQIQILHNARKTGYPILYLPVHRSHIDYVLVSWALVACDLRSPLVAAGENLNIPVFSLMMKSVGGFFIKRRLETRNGKKDIVYRAMLQSYMTRCLTDDNDMEFFIEGGRTRTGKPCLPKGGLLSIVVDTLITNKVEDILVVPVNFSYDRLLEGNFIREQLGKPKVNESFASAAMGLWNSLQAKYGNARVDFGHPFSMKEFIQTYNILKSPPQSMGSSDGGTDSGSDSGDEKSQHHTPLSTDSSSLDSSSQSGSDSKISHNDQRALVDALANHVIYDGVQCFTLMSTNAIAFMLLNKYRQGVSIETLKEDVLSLKREMLDRGHDSGYSDDLTGVVEHGIATLGPALISTETRNSQIHFKPVLMLPNVIELAYYSNCVLPIYALESVIATSVLVLSGENMNPKINLKLRKRDLLLTCLEYCEILHFEFIFAPPCQSLVTAIENSLEFMERQGIFTNVGETADTKFNDKMLLVNISTKYERLLFLKKLLRPIVDSYIASSFVLRRLVEHETQEKHLQMDMLAEVKIQIQEKALPYGESMALDPIRNFIQLVLRWQVLESFNKDSVITYCLHDRFNNEDAVEEVIQRLRKFRV